MSFLSGAMFVPHLSGPGLSIFIDAGVVTNNGSSTYVAAQSIALTASTTNYVYLDTGAVTVNVNTTGFPSTNSWCIATVVTTATGVKSFADVRPDVTGPISGGGGSAFSAITSGTNTGQTLTVGNGTTLVTTGTGVVEATELGTSGSPVVVNGNAPAHAGQLLISQPGNITALWADPLVQGLFAPGTDVTTGNSGGPINPVLVGAQNPSNLLKNLNVDNSGNLLVNVAASASGGTSSTFGAAFPATGTAIGASDGTNMQGLLVESSSNKNLRVSIYQGANEVTVTSNRLLVDGSGVTQPVSIAATVSENLTQVAGVTLGATAVTNFGTAPAATAVPGVNSSLFSGTTGLTNTGSALDVNLKTSSITLPVSLTSTTITGTVAVTQALIPWVFNMFQWSSTTLGTPTNFGTTPGAVIAGSVNSSLFSGTTSLTNTGAALDINLKTSSITLPVSLTSTTITGTVAVTQSTSPWVVAGTVTPADATATPSTAVIVESFPMQFNGQTFDRVTGSTAKGLKVNVPDIWNLINYVAAIARDLRALRLIMSTVTGQFVEDDNLVDVTLPVS
jgi:hypothetical protein